jgi:TfoX/Sxy family transcriptional regulator of competence genes
MAYDETLAARVRELMMARDGTTEKKMFGGIGWMVAGNMACGVSSENLIVRHAKEDAETLLAESHTLPFEGNGRRMTGFLLVTPSGVTDDEELARWVDHGAGHAASLPPK